MARRTRPRTPRIALVQHGDYAAAEQLRDRGEPETYYGMHYTIDTVRGLVGECPHLIVSLDTEPYERPAASGNGELAGVASPKAGRLPARIRYALRDRRVVLRLREFGPTHLLIRTGGELAERLLASVAPACDSTLVVFANVFDPRSSREQRQTRRLITELNRDRVWKVGNHRWPATQSMIDHGLDPAKAVAWDWPVAQRPGEHPAKRLDPAAERVDLFYAGTVSEPKGVGDLVDAFERLHPDRPSLRLTVAGDGPMMPELREHPLAGDEGPIRLLGRVPREDVMQRMLEADLVVVPSQHRFREGMPQTLTEAMISRTPIVASDHPVFQRAFDEGEGLRYFPQRDPDALARVAGELLDDAQAYHQLSLSTEAAFDKVGCDTTFGDLLGQWRSTFAEPISRSETVGSPTSGGSEAAA
jgi:glycosyltransferase involved in cell wall biosynthesis